MVLVKSQTIRLLDAFLIGPVMIVVGARPELPGWQRAFLTVVGGLTIAYNAQNYLAIRDRSR